MQQIPLIDLFEFALHVSGDKLAHLQEHFLTEHIYSFGTMHRCCCRPVTGPPVGSNIGALYQHCIYVQSKSAPEEGRVCRPKHVEQIQTDQ